MVGHHPGNLPRTHLQGTGEHLGVLMLASQPTGTLALDQLPGRPDCERGAAACARATRRPGLPSTATRRTRCAKRDLCRRTDALRIQRGADSADAQAADTGTRVRPDTRTAPDAWTPDAWTPDIHATRWTDIRTADSGGGQSDERRGWRPDILDGHGHGHGDRPLGD